jgi:hypothetical protein
LGPLAQVMLGASLKKPSLVIFIGARSLALSSSASVWLVFEVETDGSK